MAGATGEGSVEGGKLGGRRSGGREQGRVYPADSGSGEFMAANEVYNASGEGAALQGSERRSASFSAERPPTSSSPTTNGCTSAWPLAIQGRATSPASSPRRNLSHTLVSIRTINEDPVPSAAVRPAANRAASRMPPPACGDGRR